MIRLIFLISVLYLTVSSYSQNVGIGTITPSHTLHITPQVGSDPLRVDGVNQYTTERNLFVINPVTGVIKHMHIDSLATLLPLPPASTDNQNIDSAVLIGSDLTVYIENGTSATVNLSGLQDGTGTDNQNIDSLILNGKSLIAYIQNGGPAVVDLQPLLDSAVLNSEWIDGSLVGLTSGDIYPKKALFGGDTIVITDNGRIGINTITPNAPLEIGGGSHNIEFSTGSGISYVLDPTKTGGWSRGFRSEVAGNTIGNFSHYGSSQTSYWTYITGDESRANYSDPDLAVRASNGNVGIGTPYPSTKFEVEIESDTTQENIGGISLTSIDPILNGSNGNFRLKFYSSSRLNGTTVALFDSTVATISSNSNRSWYDRHLAFGTANYERMRLTTDGELGIGTTLPTELLDVNGNARFRAVTSGAYANDLCLTADGTLTTNSSDIRLKTNIAPLNYGLDEVLKLKPVLYNWKENEESKLQDIGFIAQEINEILPETVFKNKNDGFYGVNYTRVIPVLTKAIQDQQDIINEQELTIKSQSKMLLEIQKRLEEIEKLIKQ